MNRLRFARTGSGAVGLVLLVIVLLLVLVGPIFAPHAPAESLGLPGTSPDGAYPLGLDKLGRDVLSRLLWGGRSVIGLARGGDGGLLRGRAPDRRDGRLQPAGARGR